MSTTEKDSYSTPSVLTITLASLASSTSGVGRQSSAVANANGSPLALVQFKVKLGTSPTAGLLTFYALRVDTTNSLNDDGCGTSDAGITVNYAPPVASFATKTSPATGDVIEGSFILRDPGPEIAIALVQSSGVALDSTAGNHSVEISWINPTFA